MIKFFRKIRQTLLEEGKTASYLKYAIGEIVLVVIGILIALSINNWNEDRKEKLFEKKILTEIFMDVKEDLREMNDALAFLSKEQHSSHLIIRHLSTKQAYHDSLNVHFSMALHLWSLSPNTTSFDMAKTAGMYLITNDSIRFYTSKVNGYSLDYTRVLESRFQDYNSSVVLPYIQPLFDSYNYRGMKPNDYEALLNDATYLGIIKSIIPMREHYENFLTDRFRMLQKLNGMLQDEIK